MDLPGNLELDSWLYHTGDILAQSLGAAPVQVDNHLRADLRLGWNVRPNLTLELAGHNLIDPGEEEWNSLLTPNGASELPLSIFGRITWNFDAAP